MTRDDLEALRDWWDGLREVEQFAAYVTEKSNADALASTRTLGTTGERERLAALLCDLFPTAERSRWPFSVQLAAERLLDAGVTVAWDEDEHSKPVCVHGRPYGLHDDGEEDCATFRTVREFSESLARVRVLGLTVDELRAAVATADQYHPQWRSSQNRPYSQGE